MHHLAHQPKIRLYISTKRAERIKKIFTQHIRRIKPEPVYTEFLNPHFHRTEQMPPYRPVVNIQLYQILAACPSFIVKTVSLRTPPGKINICIPILIGAAVSMPLNILKRKKIPPRMIKHRIQHHRKPLFVAQTAKLLKPLIIPQPALHMIIIHRIIPMRTRLKNRPNQQRITAKPPKPIQLPRKPFKKIPRRTRKIIPLRTIPHPQRINMIKNLIRK